MLKTRSRGRRQRHERFLPNCIYASHGRGLIEFALKEPPFLKLPSTQVEDRLGNCGSALFRTSFIGLTKLLSFGVRIICVPGRAMRLHEFPRNPIHQFPESNSSEPLRIAASENFVCPDYNNVADRARIKLKRVCQRESTCKSLQTRPPAFRGGY